MCDQYMESLNEKIKAVEKHAIFAEFTNAAFVCSAQMILKLGIGTVAVVGSYLLVKGEITVLTFFMFLLVVTRMYEPLQISLQNLSAMISLDTNCKRMDEILSHDEQTGMIRLQMRVMILFLIMWLLLIIKKNKYCLMSHLLLNKVK